MLKTRRRSDDEVTWLDRLSLVREAADELDHPRSAVDVLALTVDFGGSWRAMVADGPWDAYQHARDHRHAELGDDERSAAAEISRIRLYHWYTRVVSLL
jgi:hypothetical protein